MPCLQIQRYSEALGFRTSTSALGRENTIQPMTILESFEHPKKVTISIKQAVRFGGTKSKIAQ